VTTKPKRLTRAALREFEEEQKLRRFDEIKLPFCRAVDVALLFESVSRRPAAAQTKGRIGTNRALLSNTDF
jgi:hypothetical protein